MINLNEWGLKLKSCVLEKYNIVKGSKGIQIGAGVFVLYVLLLGLWFNTQTNKVLALEINDQKVAVVSDENQVNTIVEAITKEKEELLGQQIEIKEKLLVSEIKSKEKALSNEELTNLLAKQLTFTTEATGIQINEEVKVVVLNNEIAQRVIETIKNVDTKKTEDLEIKSVEIEEDVRFVNIETEVGKVVPMDTALEKLTVGETEKNVVHKVAEGESLWTIAKKYNMSVDELIAANTDIDPGALQINDEIEIVKVEPVINVRITATSKVVKELDYKTEVKTDSSLNRGKEKVEQKGEKGTVENTYTLVLRNGTVVNQELVEAKVIKEPKPKVVVRGSKAVVVASRGGTPSYDGGGSGSFGWPTRGTLTSPFGMRRGSMHQGIDVANKSGTPIYASRAGVVVFEGWQGGYGNVIDIDHGDGYVTRYAHNSKNVVSEGQQVSRGQVIAYMGSTGRSTGPHVHFEIRKGGRWGTPLNPMRFLN